jgi:hypothetical protein
MSQSILSKSIHWVKSFWVSVSSQPKAIKNPTKKRRSSDDLKEADFRQIREILITRSGQEFTTEYIRKVWYGQRNNKLIEKIAREYVEKIQIAIAELSGVLS